MLVDESRNQLIVTKASAAHDYSRIVSGFQFLGYFVARICISHGPLWSKIKPRTLLIKDKKKILYMYIVLKINIINEIFGEISY